MPDFWPTINDFDEAVQNLRSSAADNELQAGEPERMMGRLLKWTGTFAVVYKVNCPHTGNAWALKCFKNAAPTRQQRYREIAKKLEAAKLPFVVDFNYLEPGIRVRGGWFPVLKMRWVEGLTLNEFFQQELTARERTYDLRKLPGMWVKLAHMLHKKEVAHADLQHGNVLLVPRERGVLDLRLVDYDGMHTPELADTPSGELGHLNYQHPQRFREKIYNGAVDRFSHLVIYSGIRCLAGGQAELWQRFNNDENLIFQESDFLRPAESQAFQTLWRHEDADARTMVGRLILACGRPLADAPLLDELVTDGRVRPLERAEARAVERVLAARGPLETVALPVQASAAAPGSTGVSLVSGSGAVPAAPASIAARLLRPLAAVARPLDRVLGWIVGPENAILHNFLRAVALVAVLVAIGLGFFLLASRLHRPGRPDTGVQTAVAPVPAPLRPRPIPNVLRPIPPLRLQAVGPQTVEAGKELSVAVPPEDPAQWQGKVRFSLDANAPPGANIDRQTGLFLWTPPLAEPAGQQEISVSATGREGQTTQTSFIITVTRPIPVPAPATLPAKGIAVDLGGGVKMELVLIPAGEFMMGSPDSDNNAQGDEKPQHRVRITKPFYLGKYLVTQEQWEAVMGNNPSKFKGPKNPVETVSWDDCQRFFDKLNDKIGGGKFSLPSEAQWEYACRAGSTTRYCFGDEESGLGGYAWYDGNSGGKTHPVGEKKPNAWGLYDMHGNVWEWCQDWYDGGYKESPTDDPTGPITGSRRVIRGGLWDSGAGYCRSALRRNYGPGDRLHYLGLRVSRVAGE